jgi:osmotically-inducible protein OsmY
MLVADIDLSTNVRDALVWDMAVDARHIAVSAETGAVTLSGYVPSYFAKMRAVKDTESVFGVRAVADEMEVRLRKQFSSDDSAIAATIARIFESDVSLAKYNLKARVSRGHVTLTGTVAWNAERDDAQRAVARIGGVLFVVNDIAVKPRITAGDVQSHIANALVGHGARDAGEVHVTITGSTAVLTGRLPSLIEARIAREAAMSAPGITHVNDRICIVQ